ncbi:MAG: Ig-like domain-containing protein [Steroidobacteraceae bacterium]|nr:Ig-like domain-containing protein [Steroidobacteraceae bacterium]
MRRVDTHLFNWRSLAATLTAVCGLATLAACGGGGGGGKKPPPPPPTLTSISVAPAAPTIALGGTQQFSATGNYSDGSAQSLTATATWSSSNMAVATIGSGGLATSAGSGSTTISAASGTVTGTTTLTVTAATLDSISITPADPVLGYGGATQQFRATGRYSDQTTRDLTASVTWSSSSANVATIGADGFATAVATSGNSSIRAESGNLSATTSLTVRTATVSGEIVIPDSDMGWKPSIGGLLNQAGGKIRVAGTNLSTDVVPTGNYTGTFSLAGVPRGSVVLIFDEGDYYDVFTQASKRVTLNVATDSVTGVEFSFVYHWDELAGYPPPWNTMNSQGPVGWKAQFVSDQVAFVSFRRDVPNDRIELYRTTDRGASWTMIGQWVYDSAAWAAGQPYPGNWQNFYFLDADHGVMHASTYGIPCDTGAGYFYTANGGQTWTFTPLQFPPTGYHTETSAYARIGASHIIMAGRVGCGVQGYTAGAYDALWESADAGATWTLKWYSPRDEWGTFIGVDANNSGRAVAYRGAQLQQFVLRDAQGSWTTRANGGIYNDSRDIAMVDDTAWMLSANGTVPNGTYRSVDAGQTWSKVSDGLVQDFDFATTLKGFAQAGGPAHVTYDGGASWRYQAAGGAIWPGVMDVWAFDRTHAAWAEVGFGDPNALGQLFTYVEPLQSSLELLGSVLTDGSVGRGATSVPLASYRLTSHGPTPITNGTLTLRASGSLNDATHVTAVRVWWDRDADGAVDLGDTQLASGAFGADDGTLSLSIAGAGSLEQLHPVTLLLTCDLSSASGYSGTFRILLAAAAVSGRESGGATVTATAPTDFVIASRTLTVAP